MRLEVAREGCLLGEAKLVADLLNGEFRMVAEHGFCLYDDVLRYPLADADACGLTDDGAEVFGCQIEQTGVEIHFAVLAIMQGDGFVELGEQLLDGGVVVNNLLSIGSQIGSHDSSRDIHLYGQHFVTLRDIQQTDVFQHFEAGQHYFELAVCQLERGVVIVLKEILLRVELAQDLQEPGRDDEQRAEIVVARLVSRQDVAWIDGCVVVLLEGDGVHVVVCFQPATMAQGDDKILRHIGLVIDGRACHIIQDSQPALVKPVVNCFKWMFFVLHVGII